MLTASHLNKTTYKTNLAPIYIQTIPPDYQFLQKIFLLRNFYNKQAFHSASWGNEADFLPLEHEKTRTVMHANSRPKSAKWSVFTMTTGRIRRRTGQTGQDDADHSRTVQNTARITQASPLAGQIPMIARVESGHWYFFWYHAAWIKRANAARRGKYKTAFFCKDLTQCKRLPAVSRQHDNQGFSCSKSFAPVLSVSYPRFTLASPCITLLPGQERRTLV